MQSSKPALSVQSFNHMQLYHRENLWRDIIVLIGKGKAHKSAVVHTDVQRANKKDGSCMKHPKTCDEYLVSALVSRHSFSDAINTR